MAPRNVTVGPIKDNRGKVNIAGRDLNQTFNTIYQRALTVAEEAARARKLESKLLAQGVGTLAQSLSALTSEGTASDSPYKGLLSYGLNEAEIFYGREEAKKDLLNCIKQGSLTVLHAESGAGKSSLLQAGIVAQLITNGHLALHLRPRDSDPVDFIKRMFLTELSQAPALAEASLREFLRQVCGVLGPKVNLYLLLDQFEEFFTLLKKNERQPFLEALADCLNDPSLKVRWVLALRAEALSDLAALESFGIAPFKNIYRLNRLSRSEAKEAIIEPARQYGIAFEPDLIEHILDTLTTHEEVMPTQLQLVCSALIEDLPEGNTLTLAYYREHEGGTEGILRDYLKRQLEHLPLEEQSLAWKVLRALITADRQRAVRTYDEIMQEIKAGGVSKKQIDTILGRLIERRLLFSQPAAIETFELAHDYLIGEIEIDPQEQARKAAQELLDQETRTFLRHKTLLTAERLAVIEPHQDELRISPESRALLSESRKAVHQERLARERRRRITLAATSVIAIVMSLLTVVAYTSFREAQRQADISRAGELAALALSEKDSHFDLALLFGVQGFRELQNARTEGALLTLTDSHPGFETYLSGHKSFVFSVAFSPDGKTLASGSDDGTIILWNVSNPNAPSRYATLSGEHGYFSSLAFSPDGKTLASGNFDGTITLWDVSTPSVPSELATPQEKRATVSSVAFSPDGQTLAAGSRDATVVLWDVSNPRAPTEFGTVSAPTPVVSSIAFSPSGRILALASENGPIILWDVRDPRTPSQLAILPEENAYFYSLAFSPSGTVLAAGTEDGAVTLWDISNPGAPFRLAARLGHKDRVSSVAFSPDGKRLASGGADKTIILWDVNDPSALSQLVTLSGHSGSVSSVVFDPSDGGKTLASGSDDKTIILWDMSKPTAPSQLATLSGHSDFVTSVAFSPSGQTFASGSWDNTVILWSVANRQPIGHPLTGHTDWVNSIAFSPDGKTLASGSADKAIILWDVSVPGIPSKLTTLSEHTDVVSSVAFSPDGKILASGSSDYTVILWNVSNPSAPSKLSTLSGHTKVLSSVAFSPDGRTLASGSYDNTIILWDVSDPSAPSRLSTLIGHDSFVLSLAFSPDGRTMASGGNDRTIILWNVSDPSAPSRVAALPSSGSVYSVTFNPDGKRLASASDDGSVTLWDVSNPHLPSKLATLTGHRDIVTSVAFSPDGKMLASGSWDNDIILWDLNPESWEEKACQRAGRNFTQTEWAQYFPGEKYMITCSQWPAGK